VPHLPSDEPIYRAGREPLNEGMRMAGCRRRNVRFGITSVVLGPFA